MKYFTQPFTTDSINRQFKELAKLLHPDKNGNENQFKEMVNEKEILLDAIQKVNKLTPVKKKPVKKTPQKHIHIVIDGNKIFNKLFKKLWN